MYDAFIEACAEYPGIADNVVFVGDENLTIKSKPRQDAFYVLSNPLLLKLLKYCPFLIRVITF